MSATTATRVAEFSSIALQTKLRAAMRAGTLRQAWRLSDRREVLLTVARCHVAEATSNKVWSAPYPSSAGEGLAVQVVMAVEAGCDPFRGGDSKHETVAPKGPKWTTLGRLRKGAIFETRDGVRAVKSEYHYGGGQCECVLLGSGEYAHFPRKNAEEVREIEVPA